jgi:hypothetical protein
MFRVAKCYRAYQEYLKQRRNLEDSDDDDGPQDEDAWLFEDLALLGKLYSRLRDKEQLIALIFEVCQTTGFRTDLNLALIGSHSGIAERHNHNILCSIGSSLQSCKYRRFLW